MKNLLRVIKKGIVLTIACVGHNTFAQKQQIKFNLSDSNRVQVVNRDLTLSANKEGKTVIHLDSKPNPGVAWINTTAFATNIIEFDVKGKNILQQSFVGIAFHGLNDSTYEAIYFRPFNFLSPDTARSSHSVQYISLPQYDWSYLREKHPGKYENALINKIDPEGWFHVKMILDSENITVYVNDDHQPSLVVKPLSSRTAGKTGFWVGNNSEGNFSNLSIQNK